MIGTNSTKINIIVFIFIQYFSAQHASAKLVNKINLDGIWATYATKEDMNKKSCAEGYSTFHFHSGQINTQKSGGKVDLLAKKYEVDWSKNNPKINILLPEYGIISYIPFSIIDVDKFSINKIYAINPHTKKFKPVFSNKFFLKRC